VDALPARRLIVVYAMVVALGVVSVLLPGGPSYQSGGFVFDAVISTLIVWRLWHASQVAWFFGLFFALIAMGLGFVMGVPADLGSLLMTLFSFAQIVILFTPPVLRFVWSRSARPVASS
jgi:hypothetical protein